MQAGQPILRLVNPVTSTVQFTLPENALPLLRDSSTRFTVAFDNYRGAAIPARLKEYVESRPTPRDSRVADSRKPRSGPLPHLARHVVHDHHVERRSRSRCRVAARFGRLRPAGGGTYVWIVGAGDRVMRREVTLGELFGRDRVVVDSGVAPGERVVTAGVYQLREGERVRILN